jgi:transcriptional regulator with XRE-family HTH domain
VSFGRTITQARKRAGLSQKDLAARIKKEDGDSISPQYLNDLEHDRRNPPSEYLLKQFAGTLDLSLDYLYFVAGQIPQDLRGAAYAPDQVQVAFRAFRRTLETAPEPGSPPAYGTTGRGSASGSVPSSGAPTRDAAP